MKQKKNRKKEIAHCVAGPYVATVQPSPPWPAFLLHLAEERQRQGVARIHGAMNIDARHLATAGARQEEDKNAPDPVDEP